eukprot:430978-Rhodomonas_salina.3
MEASAQKEKEQCSWKWRQTCHGALAGGDVVGDEEVVCARLWQRSNPSQTRNAAWRRAPDHTHMSSGSGRRRRSRRRRRAAAAA